MHIPEIKDINKQHWQSIQARFDNLIKPVGSLARLEDITCLYAAARNLSEVCAPAKTLLLFVCDYGADAAHTAEDSTEIFRRAVRTGRAPLCVLADFLGARVAEVFSPERPAPATKDSRREEAMTEQDFLDCYELGRTAAAQAIDAGAGVLGLGYYGRGALLSRAVLGGTLWGGDYPSGLTPREEELSAEIAARHKAVAKNDLRALVKAVGGLELPAMLGAILQAASMGAPVFLDGAPSLWAAFLAARLAPAAADYLIAAATTTEPGEKMLLTQLNLSTMLDVKLRSPSGEGSLLGFNLLDAGIRVLNEMDSFGMVHWPLGDIK